MEPESENLPQLYQVNVGIIEGRHLALRNTSTKVNISIGKRKKTIHAKNNRTDNPYFNDFCIFPFRLPLNALLDEIITIRVYQKSITKKIIGSFRVDLATVWSQPNHQFYHKWGVLVDPKDPTYGVKGFLKCDIAILSKGIVMKPSPDDEGEDTLEKNLLVPHGGTPDRRRTRIVVSVFRADSFSPYYSDKTALKFSQPYVKITYGGKVAKTRTAKNHGPPVWNEELAFPDLFPPLTQNILVELCDRHKFSQKSLGNTSIDIRDLYEDGSNGFLPTFGPNFLYLYHPFEKFERHRNCCTLQNGFTYVARVLIALRTEVVGPEAVLRSKRKRKHKILPQSIPPLIEKVYFEYKKFFLFAAIFDALFFDVALPGKNINFRMTLGPKKNPKESPAKARAKKKEVRTDSGKEPPKHLTIITGCNTTPKQTCSVKEDYSFIAFSGKFPCAHIFGEWPDSLRRMYCSNVIKKAIQSCKEKVNKIKYDLQFETDNRSESSQKLKATLADLSKTCEVILPLTDINKIGDTNLCRLRKQFYHREIADIALKAKVASEQHALKAEDELNKISNYLAKLTKYAQDPENSFPDTEIWLLRHNKAVAQYRIRTEDIVYSADVNHMGLKAGRTQAILFKSKKGKIKAKIDIFVWFGLADDYSECLKMLPDGSNSNHPPCVSDSGLKIPSLLIYNEEHHFQCRVHIYQGIILFGFDDSGLADPFVRVIITGQNKKTRVRKATLSPIWDETIIVPLVTLYGPSGYIKENPISITVELFDSERFRKPELIGRGFLTPVIKLKDEKYKPPSFPPKLKWESIYSEMKEVARILMATELLELSDTLKNLYSLEKTDEKIPLVIPNNIRPRGAKYRVEVLFWGIRELKKKQMLKNKVFVTLECGENLIKSPILHNVRHKLNFHGPVQFAEIELPEEAEYCPPLALKLFHISSMTHNTTYVGTCLVPSVRKFLLHLLRPSEKAEETSVHLHIIQEEERKKKKKEDAKEKRQKMLRKMRRPRELCDSFLFLIVKCFRYSKCKMFKKCETSNAYELEPMTEDEETSWWMRFQVAAEGADFLGIPGLTVYREELEAQPEFEEFQDFLQTFNVVTGHEKKPKRNVLLAKVKAAMTLYKWPLENREVGALNKIKSKEGFFSNAFSNAPLNFVLRVYVICGKNLAPKDVYGKADPYLFLQLGNQTVSDRKSYHPKQVNPTFGKCYELKGTFPRDHLLRIKVIDHDIQSHDDLIGETSIDVENRFYSKYHATCGIANKYERFGVNFWRDMYVPSEILLGLCKRLKLQEPVYYSNRVVVEGYEFATAVPDGEDKEQMQALSVLNRWHQLPIYGFHLVPEHVETRSLYHPALPGIEQGKLELWVDIFPADYRFMPPKVDVTPQRPVAMELRAIVWNVVDVVLEDRSLLVSGKLSDIYIKGWILSLEEQTQKTDIHFRSMNGQGNFNWRFIFRFDYIPVERRMVVKKKIDAFDTHPEERKLKCQLEIQVWDNDMFGDDYLGTLILELCSMPRGAKLSSRCTLKMLAPNAGKINLFKIKRTRGWWPFRRLKMKETVGNEFELTGKIDLELEILTEAEAEESPAGKGREEPDGLPPPNRPDTSFNWLLNPFNTFRYIIFRRIIKFLIIFVILILFVFFLLTALYAFPNYTVKKLLGA